jgi:hypothetical protein
LGSQSSCANAEVELMVTGTGSLAGFNRLLTIPLIWESDSAPRNPGQPVQTFDTEMIQLQDQLFGDPDFDVFELRAGIAFGLPSPGERTLTELPANEWNVDSFFDVTYEIEFQGAPGSVLQGLAGTTTSILRIRAGEPTGPSSAIPALPPAAATAVASLLLAATPAATRRRR